MPELRFPEFRDFSAWENEPLKNIYSFQVTNSLSRDKLNYKNGTVRNIHYGDIHTKFNTLFDVEKENVPFINSDESLDKIRKDSYCQEGDMIFADASEDLDDIGKSIEVVNLNNEKLVSGLHTILARQINDQFVKGFGGHLFKSARLRTQIKKESQGAKVLGVSAGRLARIMVCFPSDKKEQKKIVECLTSLDELIAAQAKKVEALKDHKKGLMQKLFPAKGETIPRLRFPEFLDAGEWKSSSLGDIASIRSGATPLRSNPEFHNGGNISWVKTTDLNNSFIFKTEECITSKSKPRINPEDSVLVAMYGGFNQIGRTGYLKMPAATNQAISVLNTDRKNVLPIYLLMWLNAKVDNWKRIASSSRKDPNITGSDVAIFPILYPRIKEQQKIADCLSSIDELIFANTQKLESLKTHKKGLMQKLFPVMDEVDA